jgi:hypothetical protein
MRMRMRIRMPKQRLIHRFMYCSPMYIFIPGSFYHYLEQFNVSLIHILGERHIKVKLEKKNFDFHKLSMRVRLLYKCIIYMDIHKSIFY